MINSYLRIPPIIDINAYYPSLYELEILSAVIKRRNYYSKILRKGVNSE